MSNYTPTMVSELQAQETWTYSDCQEFAEKNSALSTRSVISKVKSLGLTYVPKPTVTKNSEPQIRKSDIVNGIAQSIGANSDALAGLAKSDKRSLTELVRAIEVLNGSALDV